jgi:sterol 3beta-glucosyltransferase
LAHLALLTNGSRGDFQPFLALARALERAGHSVMLAGPRNDAAAAARCGVPYVAYELDFQELVNSVESRRALRRGGRLELLRAFVTLEREHGADVRTTLRRACAGADLIVPHYLLLNWAQPLAEALGRPVAPVVFQPVTPRTAVRANPLALPGQSLGAALNRLSYDLADQTWWLANRGAIQRWRRELGLAPARESIAQWMRRTQPLMLHGYSAVLAPRAADWWPGVTVTGHWELDAEGRALLHGPENTALEQWLDESADAPVYLGFGSLPMLDAAAVQRYSRAIAERLGRRVLVVAGWSELPEGRLGDHLFVARTVDHVRVFPRCAAIVHHGGAGTTHAALAAGLPAVVCAVFADQPFWGYAVEAAQAGVLLPFRRLNEERLVAALQRVMERDVIGRAAALGATVRGQSGVDTAVSALDKLIRERSGQGL